MSETSPTVTWAQFNDFSIEYYKDRKNQRLGQAFWNKFGPFPGRQSWPELFYSEDHDKTMEMIAEVVGDE